MIGYIKIKEDGSFVYFDGKKYITKFTLLPDDFMSILTKYFNLLFANLSEEMLDKLEVK